MINKKERELEAKRIGSIVVKLRKEKGLSQSETAKRMGVKQQFLSSIESGKHVPYEKTRMKLAYALDVSVQIFDTPIQDHRYEPRSFIKLQENRTPLGKILHEARMKKHMTIRELASLTTISVDRLSKYENSNRTPMFKKDLKIIADALELDTEFLLTFWTRKSIPEAERVFGNRLLCIRCNKKRFVNQFHMQPRRNNKSGHCKYCKYCVSDMKRAARIKNNGKND